MRKLYLVCGLNDANYTDASYSFCTSYGEAVGKAVEMCRESLEECKIELNEDGFRVVGENDGSFYVSEIKQICADCGPYLLVIHHAYEGVGFEIHFQGTYEECVKERKKEMRCLVKDLGLPKQDICDNVVDTGIEWEVFENQRREDVNLSFFCCFLSNLLIIIIYFKEKQ